MIDDTWYVYTTLIRSVVLYPLGVWAMIHFAYHYFTHKQFWSALTSSLIGLYFLTWDILLIIRLNVSVDTYAALSELIGTVVLGFVVTELLYVVYIQGKDDGTYCDKTPQTKPL